MKLAYTVEGSVRGIISRHRTLSAACRSLLRDQRQCSGLGGGSYSDAAVRVHADSESYPVPVGTYRGEWRLGEWDDHVPESIQDAVQNEE